MYTTRSCTSRDLELKKIILEIYLHAYLTNVHEPSFAGQIALFSKSDPNIKRLLIIQQNPD